MSIFTLNMALVVLAALSLATASSTGARLSGAVVGPTIATDVGVPHRHYRNS